MYKALILDFDGVILNSEPIHYQAYCELLHPFSLTLSESDYFQRYAGLSDKELFPKIIDSISPIEIDHLIQQKISIYQHLIHSMPILPLVNGLQTYLEKAHHVFSKIAVCSGSTRSEVKAVLDKLTLQKITPSFHTVVTVEDVQHGKPSPEGYLLTAEKLDILPEHCLVIEDSPNGIMAAKKARMSVIALTTTFDTTLLQQADAVFKDFVDLQANFRK